MSGIEYRGDLNRPLTQNELDDNFRYKEEWLINHSYKQNMVVLYDDGLGPYFYKAKNDTQKTTFDALDWTKIGTGGSGVPGIQGATGSQGATGLQGVIGNTGSQGVTGADSTVKGATGATGSQGIKGDTGSAGPASTVQGPQGVTGSIGETGSQGVTGSIGATSTVQGPQGIQGVIGIQGIEGAGLKGLSTSAFALDNVGNILINIRPNIIADGYATAFLNNSFIHIAKNSDTTQYQISEIVTYDDVSGDTTIKPPIYLSPSATLIAVNDWTIQGSSVQGPTGATGDVGATGITGSKGTTGDVGPAGATSGLIGPTGPTGSDGLPGVGATGPQGLQGFQGIQGATGSQGIQGVTGQLGATGDDGITGIQGATGSQGATGETGETGSQGATGETGATGVSIGATNGLSIGATSGDVELGGKLNTFTIIDGNGQFLRLGDDGLELQRLDFATTQGGYNLMSAVSGSIGYLGSFAGTKFGNTTGVDLNTNPFTNVTDVTSEYQQGSLGSSSVIYASAGSTARMEITMDSTSNKISNFSTLGGESYAEVSGNSISLGTKDVTNTYSGTFTITNESGLWFLNDASGTGIFNVGPGYHYSSFTDGSSLTLGTAIFGNVFTDGTGTVGMKLKGFGEINDTGATADYSGLVGISLVPKVYVDDAIINGTVGATNGLSIGATSGDVELGGTLIQDTFIHGDANSFGMTGISVYTLETNLSYNEQIGGTSGLDGVFTTKSIDGEVVEYRGGGGTLFTKHTNNLTSGHFLESGTASIQVLNNTNSTLTQGNARLHLSGSEDITLENSSSKILLHAPYTVTIDSDKGATYGGKLILSATGNVFTDHNDVKKGLEYGASYSSNYTNRSLVDKEYVTTVVGAYLPLVGGTLSGNLLMGANNITGVNDLTTATIDVTKASTTDIVNFEHTGGEVFFGGNGGVGTGGSNLIHKTKFNTASSTIDCHQDFAGTVGLCLQNWTTTGGLNNYASMSNQDGPLYVSTGSGAENNLFLKSGSDLIIFQDSAGSKMADLGATALDVIGDITLSGTVDGRDVAVDGTKLDTIETNATADQTLSKTFTLEAPTATDDITIFRTDVAITVQEVIAVSTGTTPSTTYVLRHHTDRANAGNLLTTSAATTSTTTGDTAALSVAAIPADSWVWYESTAASGTDVILSIDIRYTED